MSRVHLGNQLIGERVCLDHLLKDDQMQAFISLNYGKAGLRLLGRRLRDIDRLATPAHAAESLG